MSDQYLKLRRSSVPGKRPSTGSIDFGELALNTYDGLVFMKKTGSNGEEVIAIGNTSGSYTGSFSGSFTGDLLGTSSYSIYSYSSSQAVTASNTILQNRILANQTVGGVSSGTTFNSGSALEYILRSILITYIPPTLSSLTVKSGASTISTAARDVGNSFTINSSSFNATADNPDGIYPLSASFTGSNADVGTITTYFGNNVLSTSNTLALGNTYTINRATSAGDVSFIVNGRRSDSNALISSISTSISFQWRNYLSASDIIPTDDSLAQAIVNLTITSTLSTSRNWTATCSAANDTFGNFTYIIYPDSFGALSNIIQNGALSVLSAFTNLGTFTIVNAYGASILVRIYKSNSDKAFASGTTLAIS